MPVLLWTDILVLVLLVAAGALVFYARGREHLRAPWRRVGADGMAMSAAVVLGFYVVIGLLDSVHFRPALEADADGARRYATEITSAFDWLVTPLREREEKTYSAPFATRLYVKETADDPAGGRMRIYPRLEHGGAHLTDPAREKGADVAAKAFVGAARGVAVWLALCALVAWAWGRRHGESWTRALRMLASGATEMSWRAVLGTLGAGLVLVFVLVELAGAYHVLGTDKVGQDVLYQALKSVRTGLLIGTLTTLVMLPFAILLGIMAGYFRGVVDDIIQYVYTTLNSIPSVLLIAAAVLMLQVYLDNNAREFSSVVERADLRLLFLCLILGVTSWTGLCRYLRAESLKLREVDYVQAATALGVSHLGVIFRHILPNVMHIVMITVVLDFSGLVLAEAVLSYVQIGVDPTMHSWGNMINGARLEMAREPVVWWSLAAAFVFMFTLVLAANLFSDAVRDAFDPRLRR